MSGWKQFRLGNESDLIMIGSISGSLGDPVIGTMAALSVAFVAMLGLQCIQELHQRRKLQRVQARLRQKHLGER